MTMLYNMPPELVENVNKFCLGILSKVVLKILAVPENITVTLKRPRMICPQCFKLLHSYQAVLSPVNDTS